MINVILTIHVLIVLALIGIVLIQRSDGGALGLGGGGGGGFMTGAGAANALTRTTSLLAAGFFATSLGLAIFAQPPESQQELIRELTGDDVETPGAPATTEDLLRTLGGSSNEEADAPASGEPEDDGLSLDEAVELAPAEAAPAEEEAASDDDETPL